MNTQWLVRFRICSFKVSRPTVYKYLSKRLEVGCRLSPMGGVNLDAA